MRPTLHRIRRLQLGNSTVEETMGQAEKSAMIHNAAEKLGELFDVLRIDHRDDHNTRDTPRRVARMFVEEILRGRYEAPPNITDFDNAEAFDQLIVAGPIELRSTCAHHLMPIYGHVFVGALPSAEGRIIGLSKYDRIIGYFAARLQIQEELVKQIGQHLVDATAPRGLAVRISAVHMCKTHRGVRAGHRSRMVNTAYYGELAEDRALQSQFLQECFALERGVVE